jgi:hypothetical protein
MPSSYGVNKSIIASNLIFHKIKILIDNSAETRWEAQAKNV